MIKRFLKDSVLYAFANLFTKGIGFILLPLYLRYLSATDYGTFDFIIVIGAFVNIFVTLELYQAVIRLLPDSKYSTVDKNKIISSSIYFYLLCYLVFFCICCCYLNTLSTQLFGSVDKSGLVILSIVAYFTNAFLSLIITIFRAQLNSRTVVMLSFSSAILVGLISYILLSFYKSSFLSLILGLIFGQGIVIFYSLILLKKKLVINIDGFYLRKMLNFSVPLVLSSAGVLLATLVDRVMIKQMLGYEELGLYSVAARYASIISIIIVGFQSALTPLIYGNLQKKTLRYDLKRLFICYIVLVVLVVLVMYLAEDIIVYLIGADYIESVRLLPLMTLSVAIHSAYIFFAGLSIEGKTQLLAVINILVGICNIAINYTLIPLFGITGAVYATLFSSLLYLMLNMYFSEKYFPIFRNR